MVKNNKLQLSTERRCAMPESNYERHSFINLSAAEKRTSHGDKTLNPSLRLICIESIILRKMSSAPFSGLFRTRGSGGSLCFLGDMRGFKGLNSGCGVALSTWTAPEPSLRLLCSKCAGTTNGPALLFPGEEEKAPVKSAWPNLSEFLMKERMQQEKPRSLPS